MKRLLAVAALAAGFAASTGAWAEPEQEAQRPANAVSPDKGKIMYVVENSDFYLRNIPKQNAVARGSVKAGDPVKVLAEQGAFSFIEDLKGRQKWIESKYLQESESSKVQVMNLQRINEELNNKLANIDTEQARELKVLKQQYAKLVSDYKDAKGKLEEQGKKIDSLSAQNEELTSQVENSEQQIQTHWAKIGAMLVGIGLILGVVIVYLPKPHRRRKDPW